VSWDVVLLRFRDGAAAAFDVDEAKRIVLAADGVLLTEPGVAEITNNGVADIHFGGQSGEIMFFVYAGSLTVTQLIYEVARDCRWSSSSPPPTDGVRQSLAKRLRRPCRTPRGAAGKTSTTISTLPYRRCVGLPQTSTPSLAARTHVAGVGAPATQVAVAKARSAFALASPERQISSQPS
jgi:hypothetical protein